MLLSLLISVIRKNTVDITTPAVIIIVVTRARIVLPPDLLAAKAALSFKAALSHNPSRWIDKPLKFLLQELLLCQFFLLLSRRLIDLDFTSICRCYHLFVF